MMPLGAVHPNMEASVVQGSGGGSEAQGDVGDRPPQLRMLILPFKLNQDRRHHIPRQQHKVTNWPAYDASLRQRGSLTVWFTDEAIAAWVAEPRTTRGGQPWYSPLAILTALTLRAVFRLALPASRGADRLHCQPARPQLARAGPHDPEPACGDAGRAAAGERRCGRWQRAHAPAGGQHGPEAVRQGRVAAGKTRDGDTPVVAGAALGRGCLHRPDRGFYPDPPGRGRRVASRSLARPGRRIRGVVHRRRRLRPGSRLRQRRRAPS